MKNNSVTITDKEFIYKDEWWCNWFKCPSCEIHNITHRFNYCPNCGTKLKWDLKINKE